jgi:hypothetical protein
MSARLLTECEAEILWCRLGRTGSDAKAGSAVACSLAIIGMLFLVSFYYLIFSAAVLHGEGTRGRAKGRFRNTQLLPMKTAMNAAAGRLIRAGHDLSSGRPDRALAALESITGDELESYEFWSVRAASLYELRRWSEAIEAAREGLERCPTILDASGVRGAPAQRTQHVQLVT